MRPAPSGEMESSNPNLKRRRSVPTLAPPTPETETRLETPEMAAVRARFPAGSITPEEGADWPTWIVRREVLADLARELRDNPSTQLDLAADLFGVDYPDREERFDVIYNLYSIPLHTRLFLKVPVREDDAVVPSLIGVWQGLNWFERELFDMFGIRVEGHPNLRRILCHEAFQGHALRK